MAENATIARPYARAAFDFARAANALRPWSELLQRASATVADERVAALIGNPHVKAGELVDFLAGIAGATEQVNGRNFLQLLAENRRLALLPEIAAQYELLRAEVENTVDVTVTSAQPLTAEQSAQLEAALVKRLQRQVRLHAAVDAALIGGAVVRAGDFVVDGSLKGRLERLAGAMAAQ